MGAFGCSVPPRGIHSELASRSDRHRAAVAPPQWVAADQAKNKQHALGEVHPIVFGAYGEVSEGMEVLIGKLADAWAPQIAD
jgi:hypothetical protein